MSLITLNVKEKDSNVYQTARAQDFDPLRVKRVEAKGSDALVHYYDSKESRTVEYLVDETDLQVAALVSSLRFENTLFVDGNPTSAANTSVLYQEDLAHVSSVITVEGFKRVTYNMGDENTALNKEIDMGSEILVAVTATKKFTVKGDQTKVYKNADVINVNGSSDNDGAFTVAADSVFADPDTEVEVAEAISNNAGGFITK